MWKLLQNRSSCIRYRWILKRQRHYDYCLSAWKSIKTKGRICSGINGQLFNLFRYYQHKYQFPVQQQDFYGVNGGVKTHKSLNDTRPLRSANRSLRVKLKDHVTKPPHCVRVNKKKWTIVCHRKIKKLNLRKCSEIYDSAPCWVRVKTTVSLHLL